MCGICGVVGIDSREASEPVGFRMALGMKDNRLVLAAAEDVAVPLPLASLIRDRMLAANDFWTVEGHDRSIALNSFFEHLGLIAGRVLVSVISLQVQGETLHEASHDLQPSP